MSTSTREILTGARTMWELVERRAQASSEHPTPLRPDGETLTFGQSRDRAERVAAGLHARGVTPHRRRGTPHPHRHGCPMAPSRLSAMERTTVSMWVGSCHETTDPLVTPLACRPAATRSARSRNWPKVSVSPSGATSTSTREILHRRPDHVGAGGAPGPGLVRAPDALSRPTARHSPSAILTGPKGWPPASTPWVSPRVRRLVAAPHPHRDGRPLHRAGPGSGRCRTRSSTSTVKPRSASAPSPDRRRFLRATRRRGVTPTTSGRPGRAARGCPARARSSPRWPAQGDPAPSPTSPGTPPPTPDPVDLLHVGHDRLTPRACSHTDPTLMPGGRGSPSPST